MTCVNRMYQFSVEKIVFCSCSSETLQAVSSDPDDSIIPDSPVLQSSLPVANRLRKHKSIGNVKHVRYSEMPLKNTSLFNCESVFQLEQSSLVQLKHLHEGSQTISAVLVSDLRNDPFDAPKNPRGPQVLVPNTCELDTPQIIGTIYIPFGNGANVGPSVCPLSQSSSCILDLCQVANKRLSLQKTPQESS